MNSIYQKTDEFVKKIKSDFRLNLRDMNVACQIYTDALGRSIRTEDAVDRALNLKRAGRYEDAILIYMGITEQTLKAGGILSPVILRSLCKSLMCINDYLSAHAILYPMFLILAENKDMLDREGMYVLNNLYNDLKTIYIDCMKDVLSGNLTELEKRTAAYSGNPNYCFSLPEDLIIKQFEQINR